ncbi:MAG: cardiolipin synthase [bacterium]
MNKLEGRFIHYLEMMIEVIYQNWPYIFSLLLLAVNVLVTLHIIFYKRNVRAAVGWIGLTWLSPGPGALLYFIFGINRIRRRAGKLFEKAETDKFSAEVFTAGGEGKFSLPETYSHLGGIDRLVGNLTELPLTAGNRVKPLFNGDEAYPDMLREIREASETITLSTYIFDNDRAGQKFLQALAAAGDRGVEIRVLIDDMGEKYSYPGVAGWLTERGIPCQKYMKSLLPWHMRYYNLRSHRKIMVVDGRVGYTGGMNIREGVMHSISSPHLLQDVHFRLEGPVVAHLQQVFAEDWYFTCGEKLLGAEWFPSLEKVGNVAARGIADGPDENYELMEYTFLAGIINARETIRIMTPYFLPELELDKALKLAALEGIDVELYLPQKGNLRMVQWASNSFLESLLEKGVKIYSTSPPFAHSKLMIVDGYWSLIGSANWDPRSLKLNFEFNVECYGEALASDLEEYLDRQKEKGRRLTKEIVGSRGIMARMRDNTFRLFSPYL